MIERGDWQGAAGLQAEASRFPYVDAITYFAHALGAARSGQVDGARADIAKLAELRDKLTEAKDAYWSEQVEIQRQVASAWLLNAEDKQPEAFQAMAAAADAEDKTEKSIVTPGPLAPARELYGVMLLERGMAKEALAAFQSTLAKEPNRLGATIGAARAAEKLGDAAAARDYYAKAVALADGSDASRVELAHARAVLAKN
jgi:tetratricopeptide (TPR) repeat protein